MILDLAGGGTPVPAVSVAVVACLKAARRLYHYSVSALRCREGLVVCVCVQSGWRSYYGNFVSVLQVHMTGEQRFLSPKVRSFSC